MWSSVPRRLRSAVADFLYRKRAIPRTGQSPSTSPVPAGSQARVRPLVEEEIIDLLVGSSIYATRGIDLQKMLSQVKREVAKRTKFDLITVDDLPDDWTVVAPARVGGGGAWRHVQERVAKQRLATFGRAQLRAVEVLSDFMGRRFDAVVRVEPGEATATALLTASALGVPVIDACLSGRARPEIQQQLPSLNGIPASPAALATRWGDTVIIPHAADDHRVEDLARAVAVASGGRAFIAMNPMSGKDVKRAVLAGDLSRAVRVGRAVREAHSLGHDPIEALLRITGGYKLFHGVVTKSEHRGDRGFHWVDVQLEGMGEYGGHRYAVFVQNENIVSFFDGVVDVMPPDLICNLDPETGEPMSSGGPAGYPLNKSVVMVGLPAPRPWRSRSGIGVFGPRRFGFDFDYIPIERLQERRRRP